MTMGKWQLMIVMNKMLVFNWICVMIPYANFVNTNVKIFNGKMLMVGSQKNTDSNAGYSTLISDVHLDKLVILCASLTSSVKDCVERKRHYMEGI